MRRRSFLKLLAWSPLVAVFPSLAKPEVAWTGEIVAVRTHAEGEFVWIEHAAEAQRYYNQLAREALEQTALTRQMLGAKPERSYPGPVRLTTIDEVLGQ